MNRMIRFGVIGCGYWGPNLIRNFESLRSLGADMVVAADTDPVRRKHIAGAFPTLEVVADADEILKSPDIDAVVIATPVRLHFEQARAALENGKHALVEKPMATTVAEVEELGQLATKNDRVLMVGHTFEYSVAVNHIRNVVHRGDLGALTYIRSLRVNLGLIRSDVNVLWDLAPHDVSILLYVLERLPVTVQATGKARVLESVEDVASITLDFGEKLMANIIVSWVDPQKLRQMTFVGDRKMLVYDDVSANEKIRIFDKGVEVPRHYDSFGDFAHTYRYGDIVIPMIDDQEPLLVECQHFLECCQLGNEPRSGVKAATAVTAVVAAAERSMRSQGEVVDLKEFIGDLEIDLRPGSTDRLGIGLDRPKWSESPNGPAPDQARVSAGKDKADQRRRAIVIDPDESVRAFVAQALSVFEPGFDVTTASDVEEAAEWIGAFTPDLLIISSDHDPIGLEGFVERVLAAPESSDCRVITIGSRDLSGANRRHATLSSRVGVTELIDTVRAVFDEHSRTLERS
ncbi:MAG: Gfo/Idh/MocA family oxidoreductase [Actinobacteria bacterium]|nr:Gfo/Idh/MocA family oxidoreductase [Actinomycetota bacterium]